MTKCSFGIVTSPPLRCLCALLSGVRESTYVSHAYGHVPIGSPRGAMAPVPLPCIAEFCRGGMGDVKPEKTANICIRLGPNLSPPENARNNFHRLQEPLDQALRASAPMAVFTISVGLHGNRRVLSSENQVVAHACWKEILEVRSGFREAEERYSTKLMTLNWEEPSACGEGQAWQRRQEPFPAPQWIINMQKLRDGCWGPRPCEGFAPGVSPAVWSEPALELGWVLLLTVLHGEATAQLGCC